jgi:DNA-binding transcriptional MerR regulator
MYYSISEVSDMTGVKQHVLRYWESEFPTLRPKKNRAGNRNYRPKDIKAVLVIRDLLYKEKFTISGARKKLQEVYGNPDPLIDQMQIPFSDPHARQILLKIKLELEELKAMVMGEEEKEAEEKPVAETVEETVEEPAERVANSP